MSFPKYVARQAAATLNFLAFSRCILGLIPRLDLGDRPHRQRSGGSLSGARQRDSVIGITDASGFVKELFIFCVQFVPWQGTVCAQNSMILYVKCVPPQGTK